MRKFLGTSLTFFTHAGNSRLVVYSRTVNSIGARKYLEYSAIDPLPPAAAQAKPACVCMRCVPPVRQGVVRVVQAIHKNEEVFLNYSKTNGEQCLY
ncbi:hypothetical protein J6590_034604 [Homalodisca vitripennis]|nr:hypothetical protein J6590_034604 [Homalodisca vitripennis]